MVKIRPKRVVRSPNGNFHLVAKQTTKRGYRTACGVYFRDMKKSNWVGVAKGGVACVNCRKSLLYTSLKKKLKR